jgi:hypothetical protein
MLDGKPERAQIRPRAEYYLAITSRCADDVIRRAFSGVQAAKLGYAVAHEHQRKGYVSDAVATILDFAFGPLVTAPSVRRTSRVWPWWTIRGAPEKAYCATTYAPMAHGATRSCFRCSMTSGARDLSIKLAVPVRRVGSGGEFPRNCRLAIPAKEAEQCHGLANRNRPFHAA